MPLVVIWISVVATCCVLLWNHYRHQALGAQDFIYRMESYLLDERFRIRGPSKPKGKIGILAIDEKSMKEFGRWPFSRNYYARALNNLKAAGVKWIGFDVVFSESEVASLKDTMREISRLKLNDKARLDALEEIADMHYLSPGDSSFAESIESFQNIITGFFYYVTKLEVELAGRNSDPFPPSSVLEPASIKTIVMDEGKTLASYDHLLKVHGAVGNIPAISHAGPNAGFFSNEPDKDGVVRWVTLIRNLNGHLIPSLSLKLAAEAMDRDIVVYFNKNGVETISLINRQNDSDGVEIPVDIYGNGRALLNHLGPGYKTFKHISLADAYHFRFTDEEKKFLEGSTLVLGATATGMNDQRPNPFDSGVDGVENHAAMLDNIVSKNFMRRLPSMPVLEMATILVVGLLFGPLLIFSKALYAGIFALCFGVGFYFFDRLYWFEKGIWAYMGMPYIEMIAMFFLIMVYKYAKEEKEKKKVKGAFGLYLSPQVIDEVLADPKALSLGGQRKELTVLFSDVRGFTTISETLTPEALCDFMNHYFTPMTGVILDSKGVLDKYIGDAIMAFWGAPISIADQADVAVHSSIKMLFALETLKVQFRAKGYPLIDIGIGLNTGPMSVGNMGSNDRFTYTVMGDSVNLGSRLEALTKEYGIKIMASQFTISRLKRPNDYFFRDLDNITVKGKNEPVKVFEIMKPDILSSSQAIRDLIGEFELGRKAYLDQDFILAKSQFEKSIRIRPNDSPSHLYLKRIEEMKKIGKLENWDGVTRFSHK